MYLFIFLPDGFIITLIIESGFNTCVELLSVNRFLILTKIRIYNYY